MLLLLALAVGIETLAEVADALLEWRFTQVIEAAAGHRLRR
jgi:hypothetical protein